uniref:protein-tyrosine-phosphatase n=1 Tax=Anisakis simplex TaxID=6269 RepID=A0A0M3JVM3_ANISI
LISIISDGFGEFRRRYPDLCEASSLVTSPSASTALSTGNIGGLSSALTVNDNCSDQSSNRHADFHQLDQISRSTRLPHELSQSTYSASTCNTASCTATSVEMPFSASISQPCLPATSDGPTEILPYLYLGSQQDALDPVLLNKYGIQYVINLSVNCPRPESVKQDGHFMRIPVNDSYQEKLLPHFEEAFKFVDKVCQCGSVVLIHCLAGISRSATLAIAYIMRQNKWTSEQAYSLHCICSELSKSCGHSRQQTNDYVEVEDDRLCDNHSMAIYAHSMALYNGREGKAKFVKEKRPSISPNFNFMGQLLEYESKLREQFCLVSSTTPLSASSPYGSSNDSSSQCRSPSRFSFSHSESFSSTYHNTHQRSPVAEPSESSDEKKVLVLVNPDLNQNKSCVQVECTAKVAKSISCEHIISTNVKLARPRSFWDNDGQEPSFKMNANGKRAMQFTDNPLFSASSKELPCSSKSISAPNTASVPTGDAVNVFAGTISCPSSETGSSALSNCSSATVSQASLDRPCVLSGSFSVSKQQQHFQPQPQNLRKNMAANMLGAQFPQVESRKPDLPSPTTGMQKLSFQNTVVESGGKNRKLTLNQSHSVTNPFFTSLSMRHDDVATHNVNLKCQDTSKEQYRTRLTCCANPTFQCDNQPITDTNKRRVLIKQHSDGGAAPSSASERTLPSCCESASTSSSKCSCSACRAPPSSLKFKQSCMPPKLSASCHNLSPLQEEGEQQSSKQSLSLSTELASPANDRRCHSSVTFDSNHSGGSIIGNSTGKCTTRPVLSCPLRRQRALDLMSVTSASPRFLSRLSHCFSLNSRRLPLSRYSLSMLQQQQQQIQSPASHRCHNHTLQRQSSVFPLSLSSETLSSDLPASCSRSPPISSTESSESLSSSKPSSSSYRPNLVQSQSVILTGTSTKSQQLPTVHEFVLSQSDTEQDDESRGELMGIVSGCEYGFMDDDITPTAQRIMLHQHPEHTVSSSSTSGLGTSTTSSASMDFATSASESFHDADRDSISSASSLEIVVQ